MLNSGRIHFPRSTSFIPNFIFNVHHGPVFSILKLRSLKGMKIVVTGQAGNLSVCHSMASERPWLNPCEVLVSSVQTRTLDQNAAHRKLAEKKNMCEKHVTMEPRVFCGTLTSSRYRPPDPVKMVVDSMRWT